jgi:F-type H+-transporting ATPase subunit b
MATPESANAAAVTFPPFDPSTFPSQLFWFAVTFAVLYVVMARVIAPRLTAIVETRREKRDGDLSVASQAREKAEAASIAYEKALSEAKASAQALGQKARDEALAQTDARRKQLDAELAKRLQEAEATISARKVEAMSHVHDIAVDAAHEVLNQITGDTTSVSRDTIAQALKKAA